MSKVQGVVERVRSKVWPDGTSYFFFLEGNETMYKMGRKTPEFKEGAEIAFEVDERGSVKWTSITSLSHRAPEVATVTPPCAAAAAHASPAAPTAPYKAGFTLKDLSIVRQVSQKNAVDMAKFLIDKDLYPLVKTKSKALDAMVELVRALTDGFYADLSTEHAPGAPASPTIIAPAPELTLVPEPARGAFPE